MIDTSSSRLQPGRASAAAVAASYYIDIFIIRRCKGIVLTRLTMADTPTTPIAAILLPTARKDQALLFADNRPVLSSTDTPLLHLFVETV